MLIKTIFPNNTLTTCFLISAFFVLSLGGCSEETQVVESQSNNAADGDCLSCHKVSLDKNHQLTCTTCHGGEGNTGDLAQAHAGLVVQPAHPDNAPKYCGTCHEKAIKMVASNDHYTLRDHVTLVREAFGAAPASAVNSALLIQSSASPQNVLALTDDLLRRRCLRCHVYDEGDDFSQVRRATGCGACHLSYSDGKMTSHTFLAKPDDSRCLSCHYGNHVGADYYGRYEHDYNEEYRTPYRLDSNPAQPFGVEFHQLEADVHQQAGMICIDCHNKAQVMGNGENSISCRGCHDQELLQHNLPPTITSEDKILTFTSAATNTSLILPTLTHPAHFTPDRISCQACHARWTFNDGETHLMRMDHEEFDDLYKLSLDGSFEVNNILSSHVDDDRDLLEPMMSDKFTGTELPGIWFKGFSERRWEQLNLYRDESGTITTGRPILDLSLSWADSDEIVRFDNVRPVPGTHKVRSYTPHTIGAAGLFYQERLRTLAGQAASSLE